MTGAPLIVAIFMTIVVLALLAALLIVLSRGHQDGAKARFIAGYQFPAALIRRYADAHPTLFESQVTRVFEGLRQYFLACLAAQRGAIATEVGMPSRAVDEAWHEFILMTRDYQVFCRLGFGRYLHHTPEGRMGVPMHDALANTLHQFRGPAPSGAAWAMAGAVPLLFALDRELGFPNGFHHHPESLGQLEGVRAKLAREREGAQHAGGEAFGGESVSGGGSSSHCGDGASSSSCGVASCSGGGGGGGCSGGGGCGGGGGG